MTSPVAESAVSQSSTIDLLRLENARLDRALVTALAEVEAGRIDQDRLSKLGDALFVEGYNRAIREIRDCFKSLHCDAVVAEIEGRWGKEAGL